jgi:saccharopine dehydrogenase-like NADP-dependent oxidoreductase
MKANARSGTREIAIVGCGKIGLVIADLLAHSGDYQVTMIDSSAASIARLREQRDIKALQLDVSDTAALAAALQGRFAVLSAAPFHVTGHVANAAHLAGVHYLDLTEDIANTRRVKQLAATARAALIPQCGLAPGFITIVGYELARHFEQLQDLRLRVGALPQYPSNALNYNLTWSTDGVINEYCEPCEEISGGVLRQAPPLEEREEFSLDGVTYEAFNTSGGVGTLCETLAGRVQNLNYRTIRYPGHAAIMKALLTDLRLSERRGVLKDILEHALPATLQDVVIVFVTATGIKNGQLVQETYANKVYSQTVNGVPRSAIQITTAAGICGVLDLLAGGQLPQRGLVRQEDISLASFLANRFGGVYATRQPRSLEIPLHA